MSLKANCFSTSNKKSDISVYVGYLLLQDLQTKSNMKTRDRLGTNIASVDCRVKLPRHLRKCAKREGLSLFPTQRCFSMRRPETVVQVEKQEGSTERVLKRQCKGQRAADEGSGYICSCAKKGNHNENACFAVCLYKCNVTNTKRRVFNEE